jgi:hypothetical protein
MHFDETKLRRVTGDNADNGQQRSIEVFMNPDWSTFDSNMRAV